MKRIAYPDRHCILPQNAVFLSLTDCAQAIKLWVFLYPYTPHIGDEMLDAILAVMHDVTVELIVLAILYVIVGPDRH